MIRIIPRMRGARTWVLCHVYYCQKSVDAVCEVHPEDTYLLGTPLDAHHEAQYTCRAQEATDKVYLTYDLLALLGICAWGIFVEERD